MYTLRTRFKKEIVSEFLPPARKSSKVIILSGGMPSYPSAKALMFFLAEKNYWVFLPRYRGSWESDGVFLNQSPHLDILDAVSSLPKGFKDLWSGQRHKIKNPEVFLIGSSFGGTAVILASRDKKIKKAVALSPVIDWRVESKAEPVAKLARFTRLAFGNGYRPAEDAWQKIKSGQFFNPMNEIKSFDGRKIYLIHSRDDEIAPFELSAEFARQTGCRLTLLKKEGHLSLSRASRAKFWRRISEFLK